MRVIDYYIIGINILGFLVFLLNTILYSVTADKQIDKIVTVVCFLGGALGVFFAVVLFDRQVEKRNMMSRVFLLCILVIEIIIFLYIKGIRFDYLHKIVSSQIGVRIFLIYLLGINIVSFLAYLIDKINAIEKRTRIRIITLLALAFFGGSIGALLSMYLFRHKTHKDYFTVGVPLMIVMQIFVLYYFLAGR